MRCEKGRYRDKHRESNQLTVQLPSDILGIEASFSPLSLCIYCLDQSPLSWSFSNSRQLFFSKKALINPRHNTSLGSHGAFGSWRAFFSRDWWRPKQIKQESEHQSDQQLLLFACYHTLGSLAGASHASCLCYGRWGSALLELAAWCSYSAGKQLRP